MDNEKLMVTKFRVCSVG